MMVYRTSTRVVHSRDVLENADISSQDGAGRFLIHFGELEAAIADKMFPERDGLSADAGSLREVSRLAASQFLSPCGNTAERLRRALACARLPHGPLRVTVPEGYAYYGLFPETYAESAVRFHESKHPGEVVCIGIRSIGTSLSAVVAAALEQRGVRVSSFTVRPHGHPFDRRLALDPGLEEFWRARAQAWFAIVDEGPGLSGSSFAAVAEKLSILGIPDRHIVLFPSWTPSGDQFVSESARNRWRLYEKFCTEPASGGCVDISAGKWRSIFYGDASEYPAVQPQHEARKFLCSYGEGTALKKFAGLGLYGEAKLRRARLLSENGFCPRVLSLENGYLLTEFVPGQPLTPGGADRELLERIAHYLAFRCERFPAGSTTPVDDLAAMIEFNTGIRVAPPACSGRSCLVDGRMLPHEWLATPTGYLKTDALDHGDNHFYPGPTDIAWDIAGAISEFQLQEDEREFLIDCYVTRSADRNIRERLPFFTAAYLAFRTGYAALNQFDKQAERYRSLLEREVTAYV
jgi:hypothetical protein